MCIRRNDKNLPDVQRIASSWAHVCYRREPTTSVNANISQSYLKPLNFCCGKRPNGCECLQVGGGAADSPG